MRRSGDGRQHPHKYRKSCLCSHLNKEHTQHVEIKQKSKKPQNLFCYRNSQILGIFQVFLKLTVHPDFPWAWHCWRRTRPAICVRSSWGTSAAWARGSPPLVPASARETGPGAHVVSLHVSLLYSFASLFRIEGRDERDRFIHDFFFFFYSFTHAIPMPGFGPGESMIWVPQGTSLLVSIT